MSTERKIKNDQIEEIYPLTPMQEGLLYESLVQKIEMTIHMLYRADMISVQTFRLNTSRIRGKKLLEDISFYELHLPMKR